MRIRSASVALVLGATWLGLPGCGSDQVDPTAEASSEIGTVDPAAIVGSIQSGETSNVIAYTSTPRYRALAFAAVKGDRLDAWVRSTNGDAYAFLTNTNFKTIATNDDAHSTTKDAHLSAVAAESGRHFVVFRERDLEPATFRVTLTKNGSAPAVPGEACAVADAIASEACGTCGTRQAVCIGSTASGGGKWSPWGACMNEVPSGCTPGEVRVAEACGSCGTKTETCSNTCRWNTGTCQEPANACIPKSSEFVAAGCVEGTYRLRNCTSACAWLPFTSNCVAPSPSMKVPTTVGSVNATVVVLEATQLAPRLSGACPAATLSTATTAYKYVRLDNPGTRGVKLSVYNSAGAFSKLDTVLAAYAGATEPTTEAERKACTVGIGDTGGSALTGQGMDAALTGAKAVVVPAGGSVLVYVGGYYKVDPTVSPLKSTGPVVLNVKLDALL